MFIQDTAGKENNPICHRPALVFLVDKHRIRLAMTTILLPIVINHDDQRKTSFQINLY